MSITKTEFGFFHGYKCHLITLTNKNGMTARITNFGGAVVGLDVPDKDGNMADVVLGYDKLQGYIDGNSSHGALVGRYANRIGGAKFTVNGQEYKLTPNDNKVNHLHGGAFGYNKRVWTVDALCDGDEPSVTLGYISPDGEENYPGTVKIAVKYTLTAANGLEIDYTAVSDADTVINLTNHAYFNLKGAGNGDIKDHIVQINSDKYTPVDELLIPTGKLAYVTGTAFDFTSPKRVGEDMDNGRLPNGYDHNFVLGEPNVMRTAAEVYEPTTGRVMTVKTNKPAIQFYIGIGLDGEAGKNGASYNKYAGLCLESQYSPDSPNQPQFPDCVLKAGDTYHFTTTYEFSVR
ncbi:MAG: galactose mutarotase [Oscillospiraceae bacterium]|nr:galactose mutarotase [Oscillospiraceae bacterium]